MQDRVFSDPGKGPALVNKAELATARGLRNFDCTLPQRWLEEAARVLAEKLSYRYDIAYSIIMRYTVWCYDDEPIFGAPVYLDEELDVEMHELDRWLP